MATWGITEYGFYRPTLSELTVDGQDTMKDELGANWNVGDNSESGMLIKVQAGRESRVWQNLESVYFSQTKDGAEGNFLDERYAYFGILRRGATKGVGNPIVEIDSSAPDTYEIQAGSNFSGNNGIQYINSAPASVKDSVRAYKVISENLLATTYTLNVTTQTGELFTQNHTLTSNTFAARLAMFDAFKTFFDSIFPEESGKVHVDQTATLCNFYAGFSLENGEYLPVGFDSAFTLSFGATRIGNRFVQVNTEATEAGYNPLLKGGITSVLPTPTGFVSVTNFEDFNSGEDIESDAEFVVKGENRSDTPRSGTRSAIVGNMLAVEGVVAFTLDKTVDIDGNVTNTPIVLGGSDLDVATELERTQPIDNSYLGTTSYTVLTADNKPEVIRFTRAVEVNRSVRVSYSPIDGNSLTNTEVMKIQVAVAEVGNNINIGGKLFNGQLEGAVFGTNPKRFLTLVVESKGENEDDSQYTSDDFTPNAEEYPRLSSTRVEVIRV